MLRIKNQGYLKTAWYIFTVFILPRIGIDIKFTYKKDSEEYSKNVNLSSNVSIEVIEDFNQLTTLDVKLLYEFEGDSILTRMKDDFKKKNICILCKKYTDTLVGMAWLEPTCGDNIGWRTYLHRDSIVFPESRGKGYSPIQRVKTYAEMIKRSDNQRVVFLANIYIGNRSSIKSASKAGFNYYKTSIQFFKTWEFIVHKVL